MIAEILATIGLTALFVKTDIANLHHDSPPPPEALDLVALTASVKRMARTAERIEQLDRMITDIELCDPEVLMQNFSCSWQSGADNCRYQFLTNGADSNAAHLMRMAAAEKSDQITSLLRQLDEVYRLRWQKNRRRTLFRLVQMTAGEGDEQDGD